MTKVPDEYSKREKINLWEKGNRQHGPALLALFFVSSSLVGKRIEDYGIYVLSSKY